MKKEEFIIIPEQKRIKITSYCDLCNEATDYIHKCEICGKELCTKCAPGCDDYLDYNYYNGDRPSMHICKKCFDNGEEIRHRILDVRENAEILEDALVQIWKEKVNK